MGAYFTQELSIEGAGLLNPSMAPHPDQSDLPPGSTRFVMTLRSIGEGHLSSVELRTGIVDAADVVTLDPSPAVSVLPEPRAAEFSRAAFAHQLHDVGDDHADPDSVADADFVLASLPPTFGNADLAGALGQLHAQRLTRGSTGRTADRFARIVSSTYQVEFPVDSALQERVLMPRAPCESHGMEDVRMVRFVAPDGAVEHLGTYTAFDGRSISIQLLRTTDFRTFSTAPLSGPGARNKGLALFPRQVGGRYVALSRADRENNAVTTSADLLHWVHPVPIQTPKPAVGDRAARQLRTADRDRARLARAHPRRRSDAHLQHRGPAPGPGRPDPRDRTARRARCSAPPTTNGPATCPTSSTPAAPCATAERSSCPTAAATP